MSRIIQILIKNHVFFLFIILECISFQLLIANNFVAKSEFFQKIDELRYNVFLKEKKIKNYFMLNKKYSELLVHNDSLFKQNEILKKKITLINENNNSELILDSIFLTQAKVLKNSWDKTQNFLTIDKGHSNNIQNNMGVVNNKGLIGITHSVSTNFTTIISIINTDLMISAKIKNSGYFGTLSWNGKNPKKLQLTGLPRHVDLKVGDTIVSSGYSNILTEEIEIGTVEFYKEKKNTNFLYIHVKPFVDFTNINYVYIINKKNTKERKLIEQILSN